MADLTPRSYTEAAQEFQGRKCKVLGRKVRPSAWMRYDTERDCYVVSEVYRKRGPGYELLPREQWEQVPYAEIHRDRIVLTRLVSTTALWRFRLRHQASRTNKFAGQTWHLNGACVGNGEPPLAIQDGKVTFAKPPAQRVVDNELRKEMNRMIRKIRALFKVRSKLGAFESITFADLDAHAKTRKLEYRWGILNSGEKFLKILREVNENDLTSFYSLLWLIHPHQYWYAVQKNSHVSPDELLRLFNSVVDGRREKMRKTLGVVKYVEVAETVEASAEACGSS